MIPTGSFRTIWQGLDWSYLTDILIYVIPALLCITIHETCHGLVAYKLGDPTAKNAGRLSLNPIRHIDWVGLAMMVVFHFGWAKPVPVDMRNFKNPRRGMAVTALAGPVSNLLLAIVALALYGILYYPLLMLGEAGYFLIRLLVTTAYLSTALAVFNLIPVPPLDGYHVLNDLILRKRNLFVSPRVSQVFMVILFVLMFSGYTDFIFDWVLQTALSGVGRVAGAVFSAVGIL